MKYRRELKREQAISGRRSTTSIDRDDKLLDIVQTTKTLMWLVGASGKRRGWESRQEDQMNEGLV